MHTIADLHLHQDIVPLFDRTPNDQAYAILLHIFDTPLTSEKEIQQRQQILLGWQAHEDIINTYGYPRIDFYGMQKFISEPILATAKYSSRELRWKLTFNGRWRRELESRLSQSILLIHLLNTLFFGRLRPDLFPDEYRKDIFLLQEYLSGFNSGQYEPLIRQGGLSARNIVLLLRLIHDLQASGRTAMFLNNLYYAEACISIAGRSNRMKLHFPSFDPRVVDIQNFYHPALTEPVKNSLTAQSNILLITGPNMSGKSTLLRALGICAYLAHLGLPVPAERCTLPFYDQIIVHLDHYDDLSKGYSQFLNEVMHAKHMVIDLRSGKTCLAIFDELFNGTTEQDAADIMKITLDGLSKYKGSFFCFATHLHSLKEMNLIKDGRADVCSLDCRILDNVPRFSYRLQKGWSELKAGRILFEKEGLPELLS